MSDNSYIDIREAIKPVAAGEVDCSLCPEQATTFCDGVPLCGDHARRYLQTLYRERAA